MLRFVSPTPDAKQNGPVRGAWVLITALGIFLGISFAPAANAQPSVLETTICEINKNPEAFSGKTLRIRGFVSSEFEDFTFHSKACDRGTGIWLMYADDKTDMKYWARSPEQAARGIVYRGEAYPAVTDKNYESFRKLEAVQEDGKPVYQVTATLTGKFFAIAWRRLPSGQVLPDPGYGHMGCCHLFIITGVSEVTPVRQVHSETRGIVVDSGGEPLEGVSAEGYVVGRTKNPVAKTDKSGHFRFPDTEGDLTITKDGFLPVILVLDSTVRDYRVTMKRLDLPDWAIRDCAESDWNLDSVGDHWKFQLPHEARPLGIPNWKSFKPLDLVAVPFGDNGTALMIRRSLFPNALDIRDYLLRDLAQPNFRWIRDGRGRLVGGDIWGTLDNGEHVRTATFLGFGEVTYEHVSGDAAQYFDKIIGSGCYSRQ